MKYRVTSEPFYNTADGGQNPQSQLRLGQIIEIFQDLPNSMGNLCTTNGWTVDPSCLEPADSAIKVAVGHNTEAQHFADLAATYRRVAQANNDAASACERLARALNDLEAVKQR